MLEKIVKISKNERKWIFSFPLLKHLPVSQVNADFKEIFQESVIILYRKNKKIAATKLNTVKRSKVGGKKPW